MACEAMHFWTFTGLVGAFLDLAIAYFLLCASSITFFASKFVGLFGLSLPCPCDGLFVNPNGNYCLQRLLVDCPTEKASSVQFSVRSKFPFDSGLRKDQSLGLSMKLDEDRRSDGNGFAELEGEASCSSISDVKRSKNVVGSVSIPRNENVLEFGVMSWAGLKDWKFDMKGKRIMSHRPKIGIRRRRTGGFDYGKCSSVFSYAQLGVPWSSPSINKEKKDIDGSRLVDFGDKANCLPDDGEAPNVVAIMGDRGFHDVDLNQPIYENYSEDKNESFDEDVRSETRGPLVGGDETNTIITLEQALEEEHMARAALYHELEKERNAAATAADEAMAMIMRLQEEKASIEMQARQYQRIIEEKSAYDEEEMNILKEILLRREREKHFLEKEVEAYRQMVNLENEQLVGDGQESVEKSVDLTEDTDLMLHELSESIEKKEMVKSKSSNLDVTSIDVQNSSLVQLDIQSWNEDAEFLEPRDQDKDFSSKCIDYGNQELQEKEMVSVDNSQNGRPNKAHKFEAYSQSNNKPTFREHNLFERKITIVGEEREKNSNIHDVHVIDDNSNVDDFPHEASEIQKIENRRGSSSTSWLDSATDINRSNSGMSIGLPPSGSRGRPNQDMRRSSMSALDTERLKIDTEVEWLREKLRTVQEEREKLNLSAEHQEREKSQLKLLEDIAYQLREIRQLTEPGNAMRQVSLPPPSSKVMSKKRRCRSASLNQSS